MLGYDVGFKFLDRSSVFILQSIVHNTVWILFGVKILQGSLLYGAL